MSGQTGQHVTALSNFSELTLTLLVFLNSQWYSININQCFNRRLKSLLKFWLNALLMYSHIIVLKLNFIFLLLANPMPANRHNVYLNCSRFIPAPLRQNVSTALSHYSSFTALDAAFAAATENETSTEEISTEAAKPLWVPSGVGAGDKASNRTYIESSESESTDPRLAPALYECFRAHRYNPMFFPVPPDRPFAPIG